jgi:hypothetical protein
MITTICILGIKIILINRLNKIHPVPDDLRSQKSVLNMPLNLLKDNENLIIDLINIFF